jgi:hypothetical protein
MQRALALAFIPLFAPLAAGQAPPLSKQIDRLIDARLEKEKIPPSPRADDAEFLRRVYLDLTGRIPTFDQANAFLTNKDPNRRAKLIDELLARPEFGWHFGNHWRELIVDRGMENVGQAREHSWAFVDWLAERFNKDVGWDQTVREILTAEGEAKTNPPTTFILVNRMGVYPKPEDQVGMASRLFMGLSLRCAQCHDHPYVETWKQDDFWSLAAFFAQVRDHNLGGDNSARAPVYHEKPIADDKKAKSYASGQKRNGIIPPEPLPQIAIPKIGDPNSAEKVVKAKFFHGPEPTLDAKGPYRPAFAQWLTSPENPYFGRASVNRLWAHLFARGLIHPIDDVRPDQTGSHPELLDELEKAFKASQFQIKPIVRAICNSEAYQRTSKPLPANKADDKYFSHQTLKLLSSDQVVDALAIVLGRNPATGKNRDQMTAPFATRKADGDPTEYSHGIQQALLLMNGGNAKEVPQSFFKMTNGKSKEEAISNLYLVVLSRFPRPDELQRVASFISQGDANQGYRDLYWVLVNSAEFIFNH